MANGRASRCFMSLGGLRKGFLVISNSLPAIDLERLIKTLIFNSLEFKEIAFKQCPPLLAIPMIWNHLEITTRDSKVSNAKDDGTNYEESRLSSLKARNKTREAIDPLEENPIPTVSCLLLLASVIIIANIATSTMYVSKANKMKKKSLSNLNFKAKYRFDYPILALLFSNILQGLLTLPAYAIKKWKLGSRDLQGAICGVFRFSYFLYLYLSILISSLSTFDQLMLLKFPFQYRKFLPERRIFISIIVIVLFSLLYDTLPLLPIAEKAKKKCTHIPFKIWSITNHMIQLIFLIILIFNTIWLTRIAYQQTRVSRSIRRGMVISTYKKYEMIRLKATKTVVIMIATYIFCWGPLIVYYLIVWLCKKCFSANYMAYDQWTRLFVKILAMLYALLSPIIFGARNNLFTIRKRKEVKTFTAELKPLQI